MLSIKSSNLLFIGLLGVITRTVYTQNLDTSIGRHAVLNSDARTLPEALPIRVARLFEWPSNRITAGPHRVNGDENPHIASAKKSSIEWIRRLVSAEWLPDNDEELDQNLVMLRDAFGPFDATYVEWWRNEYRIRVSQLAGVITITLTPRTPKTLDTAEQMRAFALDICSEVINDTDIRYGTNEKGERIKVPVMNLKEKIRQYCFRPNVVHQTPDDRAIVGVCPPPPREIIQQGRTGAEVSAENRVGNPDWDESLSSWGYWWRHVGWWCDGKSVGLFALKANGGSWHANYTDAFGSRWFEGPEPWSPPGTRPASESDWQGAFARSIND